MQKILLAAAVLLSVSSTVWAEPCFGPGSCGTPENPEIPTGPATLCIGSAPCQAVAYQWIGDFAVADSSLANGYRVMGWSGPCLAASHADCPDIFNQAFTDLNLNALRANRAQGY